MPLFPGYVVELYGMITRNLIHFIGGYATILIDRDYIRKPFINK
ncbi:MAG: hypothetical protein NMNS01_01000 [Nitrosomonas sp.]|jgi:hypothetical protein|nr:MAG: hypothetical protein NMNS01_01000 [Nitrosomonas sp.]